MKKVTNPNNINESEYSTLLSNTFIYSIVTDIILSKWDSEYSEYYRVSELKRTLT